MFKTIGQWSLNVVCMLASLMCTQLLDASEEEFNIGATEVNKIYPLSAGIDCGDCRALQLIEFDNGLAGYYYTRKRDQVGSDEISLSGQVNIFPSSRTVKTFPYNLCDISHFKSVRDTEMGRIFYNFFLDVRRDDINFSRSIFTVVNEKEDSFDFTVLHLNENHDFSKNPKIVSVVEEVEVIPGWFSDSYKYQYLIQLDDQTVWRTSSFESFNRLSIWFMEQLIGSPIVIIGNRSQPYFIVFNWLDTNRRNVNRVPNFIRFDDLISIAERVQ